MLFVKWKIDLLGATATNESDKAHKNVMFNLNLGGLFRGLF